jgi:hypothetical protein
MVKAVARKRIVQAYRKTRLVVNDARIPRKTGISFTREREDRSTATERNSHSINLNKQLKSDDKEKPVKSGQVYGQVYVAQCVPGVSNA